MMILSHNSDYVIQLSMDVHKNTYLNENVFTIFMDIMDIIDSIPTWAKWTGLGGISLVVFILILFLAGGEETVTIPAQVAEVKQNATEQVLEAGTEASVLIYSEFAEIGDKLAEDSNDPVVKATQKLGWRLIGLYLGALIILSFLSALGIINLKK